MVQWVGVELYEERTFAFHRRSIAVGRVGCLLSLLRALLYVRPANNDRCVSCVDSLLVVDGCVRR